jgi:hypothetical protein
MFHTKCETTHTKQQATLQFCDLAPNGSILPQNFLGFPRIWIVPPFKRIYLAVPPDCNPRCTLTSNIFPAFSCWPMNVNGSVNIRDLNWSVIRGFMGCRYVWFVASIIRIPFLMRSESLLTANFADRFEVHRCSSHVQSFRPLLLL